MSQSAQIKPVELLVRFGWLLLLWNYTPAACWFSISRLSINTKDATFSDTEWIKTFLSSLSHLSTSIVVSSVLRSPLGRVPLGSCRGSGRVSGGTAEQQSDRRGSRERPLKPGAWGRSCGPAAGCMTLGSPSHQLLSVRSQTAPLPCARSSSVPLLTCQDRCKGGCVKGENQQSGSCCET